jgi:hypothetical protein
VSSIENNIEFYNLEKIRFIIKDSCGLDIAYAYEELVFSEHGIFIFQFDVKNSDTIFCWFNQDCNETDRISLLRSIIKTATLNKMKIIYKGKFEMSQKENEHISLNFKET